VPCVRRVLRLNRHLPFCAPLFPPAAAWVIVHQRTGRFHPEKLSALSRQLSALGEAGETGHSALAVRAGMSPPHTLPWWREIRAGPPENGWTAGA
jgi:hypothetical protein